MQQARTSPFYSVELNNYLLKLLFHFTHPAAVTVESIIDMARLLRHTATFTPTSDKHSEYASVDLGNTNSQN